MLVPCGSPATPSRSHCWLASSHTKEPRGRRWRTGSSGLASRRERVAAPPPKPLITPALFSRPLPPPSPGEEGVVSLKKKQEVGCAVRTVTGHGAHSAPYTAPRVGIRSPSPGEGGWEGAGEGARG